MAAMAALRTTRRNQKGRSPRSSRAFLCLIMVTTRSERRLPITYPDYPLLTTDSDQFRNRFFAMNNTLAGLSASLRMKYGYHSLPKGTYTRIR